MPGVVGLFQREDKLWAPARLSPVRLATGETDPAINEVALGQPG